MVTQYAAEKIVLGLVDSNKDASLIMKQQSAGMKNVMKYGDYFGQKPGRTAYGAISGSVMLYYPFKVGDTNRFMKFSTTNIAYRSSTGWADITGAAMTGDIDDYIDACTVYDEVSGNWWVVSTNGKDNMRYFDGTNNTADLSAWTSYKARFLRNLGGYLIAYHLTDSGTRYGFRARCSHTGQPNNTTGTQSKTFNFTKDINISDIMKVEHFGNYHAMYKTDCICLVWLGSSTVVLDYDVAVHKTGLRASRAMCVDNLGRHWFLGYDDVYIWPTPNSAVVPVGIGSIRNRIFKNTTPEYLKRAIMMYDQRYNQIRLYVPESYYLDTVYCLDLNEEKWSWWQEAANNVTAVGSYLKNEIVAIDDLTGTIDDLSGTIDNLGGALEDNFPVLLEGDKDGGSHYSDDTKKNDGNITIESYYDTGDDTYKNSEGIPYSLERVEGVKVEAKGLATTDKLYVYYSNDMGVTWTQITGGLNPDGTFWTDYITLSTVWEWYECHFDEVMKTTRYRVGNNNNDETWFVQKMIRIGEEREEK